jgi:hypothetical protein
MRNNPTPLALLALLAIGVAIVAGLAGMDRATPDRPRAPADPGQKQRATDKRDTPRDPLLELAARYSLVARNWTPATYRDSWRRQLALAGSQYHRELEASRPDTAELRALREDRARSKAELVRAQRDPRIQGPEARVIVTLNETTVAGGQTIAGPTVNQVDLHRRDGRWRVVGFTVVPGGTSPVDGP